MDWVKFLEENNIHYVSRGPNTKRGEVSIQCPFCGEDDPSEHLGINLTSSYWGCHRDASHRGKAPRTLIKALLRCTSHQARTILQQYNQADPDSLEDVLSLLSDEEKPETQKPVRDVEAEFGRFRYINDCDSTGRFFKYLKGRKFGSTEKLIKRYGLRCATTGKYKDRVIIPVRMNGELLGWTSRALVNPANAPRYLASSPEIKTTVFDYDNIKKGGKRLFIVEGPFDAMKVNSYQCSNYGPVRATCTFGTSPSIPQLVVLRALVKKYDETYVLFDDGADKPGEELANWVGAQQLHLPDGVKDPGELKSWHIAKMHHIGFNGFSLGRWTGGTHWTGPSTGPYWSLPAKSKHRP